jgi:flagellar protein FlaG
MSEELSSVETNAVVTGAGTYEGDQHQRNKPTVKIRKSDAPIDVEAVAKDLNTTLRMLDTKVAFAVDRSANKVIIRVVNADTDEVIRQIPPEEMLHVAARMKELLGVIFDATA